MEEELQFKFSPQVMLCSFSQPFLIIINHFHYALIEVLQHAQKVKRLTWHQLQRLRSKPKLHRKVGTHYVARSLVGKPASHLSQTVLRFENWKSRGEMVCDVIAGGFWVVNSHKRALYWQRLIW